MTTPVAPTVVTPAVWPRTGPQHVLEARRLLALVDTVAYPVGSVAAGQVAQLAQVHATLAMTAANVVSYLLPTVNDQWSGVLAPPLVP